MNAFLYSAILLNTTNLQLDKRYMHTESFHEQNDVQNPDMPLNWDELRSTLDMKELYEMALRTPLSLLKGGYRKWEKIL